jgi:subtilisin family serine protease
MDAKQVLARVLISFLVALTSACQKKENLKPVIVDDSNSQFSGKQCYGKSKQNQYIIAWSDGSRSLFHGPKEALEKQISNQIEKNKFIVAAEQDRTIKFDSMRLNKVNSTEASPAVEGNFWEVWGQEDTQVNVLWDKQIKGEGITVAVVDASTDITHPSLIDRIAVNSNEIPENGVDDDNNGYVDDYQGFDFAYNAPLSFAAEHGTHVAGIIAAEPKGGPMLGMAPKAKILPLNIMFENNGGGSLSAAVLALKYAEVRGVKVVNASWGGPICAEALRDAIASLNEKGILFVAAAGNDGVDMEQYPEFPAAFGLANQITVGATVQSGLMAAFSNYGRAQVHILAPGNQILSTVPGGWRLASGTSMAAPFVSGFAALLWSAYPEATLVQIKAAILGSVLNPMSYNPVISQGRINVPQGLQKLESILSTSTQ